MNKHFHYLLSVKKGLQLLLFLFFITFIHTKAEAYQFYFGEGFVHYPAGTFPGQSESLADNTHFNSYGGYQLSKCIIQGLIDNNTHWRKYIVKDYTLFNPAQPDDPNRFFFAHAFLYRIKTRR